MSPVFALIRRASQSLNALIRHRSGAGRVLFFAVRGKKEHFYSAEIQKGGTLGPATMLPRIPFKSIRNVRFQVRNGLIFLPVDGQFHIYSPHTGEVSTLPDVPTIPGNFIQLDNPPRIGTQRYFGFDPLSNEHKVLVLQKGYGLDESPMKALFWIFSRGSGSWSRIHPVPPFEWMLRYQFQAFNYNTGEILLQSADVSRGTTNGECLLYYNTKTGIFRKAEVTGLTPCQAESLKREVDIVDVTFDG